MMALDVRMTPFRFRSTVTAFLLLAALSPPSLLIAGVRGFVPSFITSPLAQSSIVGGSASESATSTSLHAIGVFVRKAKEADVRNYCQEGPSEDVLAQLRIIKDNVASVDSSSEPGPLQRALTKRKGTISLIAEYKRKLESSTYMESVPDPDILSPVFREFGASACAVHADARFGGCTYDDLAEVVNEQLGATGEVPGPLPVICSDRIVDEIQIARAKVAGAAAVVVSYEMVGKEKVGQFVMDAAALGLETVVDVRNKEEAIEAVGVGATILCVIANDDGGDVGDAADDANADKGDVQAKYALVSDIVAEAPICAIINILANNNEAMEEVTEAWTARDVGFNAAWVSDALYKGGNDPVEHPGAVIRSMTSKSSVKFASPKARSGKGEGAREYLGDIMM